MKINNKNKGFSILAIILVIVAVIVAIGIWALSGQSTPNNTSSNEIMATGIINDAMAIKSSFDNIEIKGYSTVQNAQFYPPTSSFTPTIEQDRANVFGPTTGITMPEVNPKAIRAGATGPEGVWIYNSTTFIGRTVGTTAADPTILLAGVTDAVCDKINSIVLNPDLAVTIRNAGGVTGYASSAATILPADGVNSFYSNWPISLIAAGAGRTYFAGARTGCFKVGSLVDNNVFFHIIKPI